MNGTVDHVIRHSFLYSYILSQPFAVYVDAYPMLQNQYLLAADQAKQLEYGQHGEAVRVLQKKLNKLSYYDDSIDGDYGILTEYALKRFQSDHKITITGDTNEKTILAIIKAEKEDHLAKLELLSESVYPGMHNEDVKIVQEALHYFGYYEGEIDGIYGPLTNKALKIAEDEHGIELTKEVTQNSLTTLYEAEVTDEQEVAGEEQIAGELDEEVNEDKIVKNEEENEEVNEVKIVKSEGYNNNDIIQTAQTFIGTPYVWGGESPGGFDCSGFIQYVYKTQDIVIPRTVSETWNFAQPVEKESVGDLLFFETYQPGPSHVGIYLGDGKFIHAGSSRGVEISELNNSYWQPRYIGAKRIN